MMCHSKRSGEKHESAMGIMGTISENKENDVSTNCHDKYLSCSSFLFRFLLFFTLIVLLHSHLSISPLSFFFTTLFLHLLYICYLLYLFLLCCHTSLLFYCPCSLLLFFNCYCSPYVYIEQ